MIRSPLIKRNISNPKFKKGGLKYWPGNSNDCEIALCFIPSSRTLKILLRDRDFSEKMQKKVKNWSFSDFTLSALSYYFEDRILSTYSWLILTLLLLHTETSQCVLAFLQENGFTSPFCQISIIDGVLLALQNRTFLYADDFCFKNLLILLKIDKKDIEELIQNLK